MNSCIDKNKQQVKQLTVIGTQLCTADSAPVVLRGMSFGWHNWWPRFYNKQTVEWLKTDWGCNVVRAAMGVEPDTAYLTDPEWSVGLIEQVIDGAIENNIYVIIDWHSHSIQLEPAKAFFKQMALKYGKYNNIIYEIYNEPVYDTWDSIKEYSEQVIDVIRAIDKNNIIIVGCPRWDQDIHIVADNPLVGYNNIMYAVHFYADTHKQWLRDRCNYALQKGIPIFVSESAGMLASGKGDINKQEWQTWIDYMESNKISWVLWSIADKNETCSVLYPSASSTGNWNDTDLKESGIMSRNYIRHYNLGK